MLLPTRGRLSMRVLNKHYDDVRDAIYIGRGSPYGNPYKVGRDGKRGECIKLFEEHVLPTLDLEPLRGHDIWCFCHPRPCHGHSIRRALGYPDEPPKSLEEEFASWG